MLISSPGVGCVTLGGKYKLILSPGVGCGTFGGNYLWVSDLRLWAGRIG